MLRGRLLKSVFVGALLAGTGVVAPTLPTPAAGVDGGPAGDESLAERWAPIHHQSVDPHGPHSAGGRADEITRVDFDGNWDARDNWEHAERYPAAAYAYASVVETPTHWFVVYMFFHARDWTNRPFFDSEHENDAEGLLLAVEKDGTPYGRVRAAITVAHGDFYSYVPLGSPWSTGGETVDGTLPMQVSPRDGRAHPVTAQEAHGHALKAYSGGSRGVVYYPAAEAGVPRGPGDRDVGYRIVDLFGPDGLWTRRADPDLLAAPGTFASDAPQGVRDGCGNGTFRCKLDAAHAPWAWDDHDDRPGRGELATDPASVVAAYFTIPEPLSRTYVSNGYRPPSRPIPAGGGEE
ncbi:hypothetical protein GCM10022255_100570 [Dactylosporangium darangshiense]|uniref:Secreted protein n=1 Tax=Dactylosporangium darangshiense TaxID=579108 RepID=A0ABP8DRV9_9ACTN